MKSYKEYLLAGWAIFITLITIVNNSVLWFGTHNFFTLAFFSLTSVLWMGSMLKKCVKQLDEMLLREND